MVLIKRKKYGVTYYQKWFYDEIDLADAFRIVAYRQLSKRVSLQPFAMEISYSIVIDLSRTIDEIFAQFAKQTRHQIKKAEQEGVKVTFDVQDKEFIDFFNKFAALRNLPIMTTSKLESFKNNKIIVASYVDTVPCAMRLYICDGKIARSICSATRTDNKIPTSILGWSNKLMRFETIKYLKEHGYETYDLGGYAKDTQDPKLRGINVFKESFGGTIVEQYNYYSPLYKLAMKLGKGGWLCI